MANYVSKHTGAQIDAAVDKTGELDGKVAALSEEIEEINNDLDNIPTGKITPDDTTFFLVFKNLFNPDTITEKHFINQTNGKPQANAYYHASDFIQVAPATTYVLTSGNESRYAFYDANKNYISGEHILVEEPIELVSPVNAEYFRFSYQEWKNPSTLSFGVAGAAAGDAPYINPKYIRLDTHSFPLNLPSKLYALVGEELNVWFDNLVDGHDTDYVFEVNCSVGMQLERCYRLVADEAGEYNLTIKAIDKHGASVTKTAKIIVAAADAGSGDTATLIVLGDSTTNNGIAIDKLNTNFMTDAEPMGIATLGTRGEGRNMHEGRSGWTFRLYFESAGGDADPSVVNPFYNPTTQTFDAAYYFANSGVAVPEWFFVNLGINDTFSYYDDETLETCIETLNTYCDQMITSLKAAASGIKIGVCLTIPPNYSQDAFGKEYKCGQTRNRYKRNNVLWVENLIEKYDGRENERIYLVPIHTNLDTKYGMSMEEMPHSKRNAGTYLSPYGNGGVHPDTDGYWQIADVYWFFLKAQA